MSTGAVICRIPGLIFKFRHFSDLAAPSSLFPLMPEEPRSYLEDVFTDPGNVFASLLNKCEG